jgi:hypothetical protein
MDDMDRIDPTPIDPRLRSALRTLECVGASDALRRSVERQVVAAATPRPRRTFVAVAATGLAAAVLALALALPGGGAPSVQAAARVALLHATAPPPATRAGGELLDASVEGIAYPNWTRAGWTTTGMRTDTVEGRSVRTVFYADGTGARIGYAIAAGDALALPDARAVRRHGVALRVLAIDGATVVTWRRDGHTCILAGHGVPAERLLTLASYTV